MIDFVRLKAVMEIPPKLFLSQHWHTGYTDREEFYYWHVKRGVTIHYYTGTTSFVIAGTLTALLHDTQVLNPDDLYGLRTDLFLEEVNAYLNGLFSSPIIDISGFHVSRIDYCFNIRTPYVEEYVSFLNTAFRRTNRGTRKNFVEEHDLDGSVYIKTASDYKHNRRKNYVLNFYSKADRLRYKHEHGQRVTQEDFRLAEDVFRLEVQCGSQYIKEICKKNSIGSTFGELFSCLIALKAIASVYERIFRCKSDCHYYRYRDAKKKLPFRSRRAFKILEIASMKASILSTSCAHGRNVIIGQGIYPYFFLSNSLPVPMLPNPIALIESKLKESAESEH